MSAVDYQVEEKMIGQATPTPFVGYVITCLVECDCPNCEEGEHRMDAFNRGTHVAWFKTREEAEAHVARVQRRG